MPWLFKCSNSLAAWRTYVVPFYWKLIGAESSGHLSWFKTKRCREASQLDCQAEAAFVSPACHDSAEYCQVKVLLISSPFFPLIHIMQSDGCRKNKSLCWPLADSREVSMEMWEDALGFCHGQLGKTGLAGRTQLLPGVTLRGCKEQHCKARYSASGHAFPN